MSTPLASPARKYWVDKSACAGLPAFGSKPSDAEVCESCPVKTLCLASAIVNREYGLWGGMTDSQRRNWKKDHPQEMELIEQVTPLEGYEVIRVLEPNYATLRITNAKIKKERVSRMMGDPLVLAALSLADSLDFP